MHVLIIPSWYLNAYSDVSGIFFKEQAEALAKTGCKVGLIAIQGISFRLILKYKKFSPSKMTYKKNGVNVYSIQYPYLPKLHRLNRVISLALFKVIFKQYIKEHGLPDVVHLHSFSNGVIPQWLKKEYDIPYIVTEHFTGFARGTLSSSQLSFAKNVFYESTANIAVSHEFRELLSQVFKKEFVYIPNLINVNYFNITKEKDTRDFIFLNIALMNEAKNQKMLIKSFSETFKEQRDVKLTIAGGGVEFNTLQDLVASLRMSDQIEVLDQQSRTEVKQLLSKSDAFVLSSKYETFGVVLIEAMSCGLPVVATRCGGPESIVINSSLGELCDINISSLGEAMNSLYRKREKYSKQYIHNYVQGNFSEDVITKRLINLYKEVINK